jgi:hypothetical protein
MVTKHPDLWTLTFRGPEIDPNDLARAVEDLAQALELDYRSRLLIRDSVDALRDFWSPSRVDDWLAHSSAQDSIRTICLEKFDEVGFRSIRKRLMSKTHPEAIRQYFEQLGQSLHKSLHLDIAGAVSLILPGYIERATSDIDVVGEVPPEIRTQYQLLDDLEKLHGLHLGHVQTHYFPKGWSERVHAFGLFSRLEVSLVDVYDVFLSKLFSARMKDQGDLKVLAPQLDKSILVERFQTTCSDFLSAPRLKELALNNWRILFGDDLPSIL